jgi:hypothetical protein
MDEPRFAATQTNGVLAQVYEGMGVYDRTGRKLGTVETVYLGELIETDDAYGQDPATLSVREKREVSLIEDFARAIAITERVSDPLRERLLSQGFMRIDSRGLFVVDRYALPEQIDSVSDGRVMLRVNRDELIKA